jgi:hypothetical protein
VRHLLIVTALALTASAFAVSPASASCAAAVRWNDTTYLAAPDGISAPRAGAPLRGGVRPGCNDTVVTGTDGQPLPQPTEPDVPVSLRRVRGISPKVAVLAGGQLYVTPECLDRLTERPKLRRISRACS